MSLPSRGVLAFVRVFALMLTVASVGACSRSSTVAGSGGSGSGGAGTGGRAGSGGANGNQDAGAGTGGHAATGGNGGGVVGTGGAGGASTGAGGAGGTTGGSDAAAPSDAGDAAGSVDANDPNAIDVYLIGGQSNATGQGYIVNLPTGFVIDTRVMLYASGPPHLDSGAAPNTWIPLRQASESPDRFGPELGFGNDIQQLYPNRKIAIIKHAHTGTSLFADWVPGASATDRTGWGPQFAVFVDTVTPALQGLRDMGYHPIIRAMLWQQGENDADAGGTPAAQYGANLVAFIARVRAQWSAPDMLFIYGFVYPPPNTGAGRDLVRQGEANVDQNSGNALATTRAFVIPTDDLEQRAADPNSPLPNDHVHFGTAGQLELGRRMAEKAHDQLQ